MTSSGKVTVLNFAKSLDSGSYGISSKSAAGIAARQNALAATNSGL